MTKNTPPRIRTWFIFSVGINIFLFLCIGLYTYQRKEIIIGKIEGLVRPSNIPSEKLLLTFNNEPLEASNEFFDMNADSTVTMLFLGNSLTYTSAPDEESDKTKRGLVSSSKEKDYVHQLVRMIAEGDGINVDYSIVNIADFERGFLQQSFSREIISNVKNQNPDWLIVQVGENVSKADMNEAEIFEKELEKLMYLFPDSRKMITIPFWTTKEKSYALTNAAISSGAYLVDLSHLGSGSDDPLNLANSQEKYKNSKAGTHPGDYGMNNIARCFYACYRASKLN